MNTLSRTAGADTVTSDNDVTLVVPSRTKIVLSTLSYWQQFSVQTIKANFQRRSELHQDCQVEVISGGKTIQTLFLHNAVVSTASPFFKVLFNGPMSESAEKKAQLVLLDRECPTLLIICLLDFIYLPELFQQFLCAWQTRFYNMLKLHTRELLTDADVYLNGATDIIDWEGFLNAGKSTYHKFIEPKDKRQWCFLDWLDCLLHQVFDIWILADKFECPDIASVCKLFFLNTMFLPQHLDLLHQRFPKDWTSFMESLLALKWSSKIPFKKGDYMFRLACLFSSLDIGLKDSDTHHLYQLISQLLVASNVANTNQKLDVSIQPVIEHFQKREKMSQEVTQKESNNSLGEEREATTQSTDELLEQEQISNNNNNNSLENSVAINISKKRRLPDN